MQKILAMALVLSLVACGAGGSKETKVSVFWYDEADVHLSTFCAELNKTLDAAGIKYDNQYAGKDQAKQPEQIKTAIAGGTNLVTDNESSKNMIESVICNNVSFARLLFRAFFAVSIPFFPGQLYNE